MTVQTNTSTASFAGNGTTTVFPIGFKFNSAADLAVMLIDDATGYALSLTLNSHYTVSGAGDDSGGSVALIAPPAVGQTLKIKRVVDILQLTDLRNQGKFFAEVHEDAFDLLTMIAQQHSDGINSAIRVSEQDPAPARLPPVVSRADKVMGFDSNGNPIAVVPVSGSAVELATNLASFANKDLGSAMIGRAVQVVGSIAELRDLSNLNPSKHAFVTGYYAQGDGGGGAYYLDAADTTSADNGGTIIVAADGGRWKLVYAGRVSIKQFGAVANDLPTDAVINASAIQGAFDSGVPLYAPAGTYQLQLSRSITLEAGATVCSLFLRDRLDIIGDGMGATVFKLRDNESTDASPKFFNLIAGNGVYNYVRLEGITFDINGQNNKISPNRGSGVYNPYNCAAVMVSGSVATGGFDARLHHAKFIECEVINSPGVTCFGTAQRYNHPGTTGSDIEFRACRFFNNGIDSADHSSIFAVGDDLRVIDCVFDHPTPSTGVQGPVVAIELHGANISAFGNKVKNYCQLAWIVAGEDGRRTNINVRDNQAAVNYFGVGLYCISPWDDGLGSVAIDGNQIWITSDAIANPNLSGQRTGLYLGVNAGDVLRLMASGNTLYCTDRTTNAGITVTTGTGALIQAALIAGNIVSGFSRGIWAGAGGVGQIANLQVVSNHVENCAATTEVPTATAGIIMSGNNFAINATSNMIGSGAIGSAPQTGIVLSGAATSLHMSDNDTSDSVVGIDDWATVSGRRSGKQALTFSAMPAQSTWKAGDVAYLSLSAVLGASPNKYSVDGWLRITDGTSNVLNTDWVERRIATGT